MVSTTKHIGLLALQGDFAAHQRALASCASPNSCFEVRKPKDIQGLHALILPGGESSAMLKLMSPELKNAILEFAKQGKPLFGTCAGAILLATTVENPQQDSLKLIDMKIQRNAYGRQKESFETSALELSEAGRHFLSRDPKAPPLQGIFIRAPKIQQLGPKGQVLASLKGSPVLVREKHILVATFHPELLPHDTSIHEAFLSMINFPRETP